MKHLLAFLAFAQSLAYSQSVLWNEELMGPLANDYAFAQNFGPLQVGSNTVIGSVQIERNGTVYTIFDDHFIFTVPSGYRVTSLFASINGPAPVIWIGGAGFGQTRYYFQGVQPGELFSTTNAMLDEGAFGTYVGTRFLPFDVSNTDYRLDFVVTPIPEPGTWVLLGVAGAACWAVRRRRR